MPVNELEKPLAHVIKTITSDLGPADQKSENVKSALQDGRLRSAIRMGAEYLVPILQKIPELELFDNKMQAFVSGWARIELHNFAQVLI